MKFNITWDPSVDAAPAAFKTEVEAVAKYFEGLFLDPVTINLTVKYNNPFDAAIFGQSQPSSLTSFSYNTIRAALANKAASADDATAALPATDPISGAHNYLLPTAEQKALGLLENYSVPASGPGYVPALVPTLLDPIQFTGSERHGLGRHGDILEHRELRLQSAATKYRSRIRMISPASSRMNFRKSWAGPWTSEQPTPTS